MYRIGRLPSCDITLDSKTKPAMISRAHALIQKTPEATWEIVDLKSLNGVFVNDLKADRVTLMDGDLITFGGGGKLAMGQRLAQPESEFRYLFLDGTSSSTTVGRKHSRPPSPPPEASKLPRQDALGMQLDFKEELNQSRILLQQQSKVLGAPGGTCVVWI
ncbi:hypothetical protein PAPYR_6330 [Paratrimastix pyriformis]|uniref:FHA domain-containing protein n=1 Tax=Paratrimastix pyriformis TaxID=342808 RepID=A0ABQ8UI10_9EUKA|nr:hypothetical protein PAPYR_6330 [Paratrimastix pyriformis]